VVSLSAGVVTALRGLSQAGAGGAVGLDRRVRGELRGLLNHYLTNLLGHPPRMHGYLGAVTDY
jgi:hypothetical protein